LVRSLSEYGKKLGCTAAWVITESTNTAAIKAYKKAGGVEDGGSFRMIELKM